MSTVWSLTWIQWNFAVWFERYLRYEWCVGWIVNGFLEPQLRPYDVLSVKHFIIRFSLIQNFNWLATATTHGTNWTSLFYFTLVATWVTTGAVWFMIGSVLLRWPRKSSIPTSYTFKKSISSQIIHKTLISIYFYLQPSQANCQQHQ
jgi:hypothetical protein